LRFNEAVSNLATSPQSKYSIIIKNIVSGKSANDLAVVIFDLIPVFRRELGAVFQKLFFACVVLHSSVYLLQYGKGASFFQKVVPRKEEEAAGWTPMS
jgi:hypothetical protein